MRGALMSVITEPKFGKEIGPNWFASVMGTGIIANAAVGLPLIGFILLALR